MARRTSSPKAKFTHEGVEITLNEKGEFEVAIDEDGEVDICKSLGEAEESIHANNLATRASVSLDLEVLTTDGELVNVRRINSGTGNWLTAPESVQVRAGKVYVDSPETRGLLNELENLDRRRGHITKRLHLRSIELGKIHFYGREDKGAAIAKVHSRFKRDFESRDPQSPHFFVSDEPVGIVDGFDLGGDTCICGQEREAPLHEEGNLSHFGKPHPFELNEQSYDEFEVRCLCGRVEKDDRPVVWHPIEETSE